MVKCILCKQDVNNLPFVKVNGKAICWHCSSLLWSEWQQHYLDFFPPYETEDIDIKKIKNQREN